MFSSQHKPQGTGIGIGTGTKATDHEDLPISITILSLLIHNPIYTFTLLPLLILLLRSLYRLSPLHPLSSIPGPTLPRLSSLWLLRQSHLGKECTKVHALHQRYGPVVVTGPNSVDISDGAALHDIYVDKGGFVKAGFYANFDIDGHKSIFSQVDPVARGERAKVVAACFSTRALRDGRERIEGGVEGFVGRWRREVERAGKRKGVGKGTVDILAVSRALAIDVVTGYLFGRRYGGCEEDLVGSKSEAERTRKENGNHDASEKNSSRLLNDETQALTANGMVDAFVAVGKIWYLPPRLFQKVEYLTSLIWPNPAIDQSMDLVDTFIRDVVTTAIQNKEDSTSYPSRLLKAGFSESEVRAQCKDLIFAGTDSTAMNLATICFLLTKHKDKYQVLRKEITETNPSDEDLQSLPYLRCVIREGLRLAFANPSRLPRVVPTGGWTFNGKHIPQGTIVSCAPYELHLNPDVFANPTAFEPERWLAENEPSEEMNRDHIAFGLGSRQCIARNLATAELFSAVSRIVREDLLSGMECFGERIEILEWFNSHVVGGKIELEVR